MAKRFTIGASLPTGDPPVTTTKPPKKLYSELTPEEISTYGIPTIDQSVFTLPGSYYYGQENKTVTTGKTGVIGRGGVAEVSTEVPVHYLYYKDPETNQYYKTDASSDLIKEDPLSKWDKVSENAFIPDGEIAVAPTVDNPTGSISTEAQKTNTDNSLTIFDSTTKKNITNTVNPSEKVIATEAAAAAGTTTTESSTGIDDNMLSTITDIYNKDMANLDKSRRYAIGSAVGQSLLNMTNLTERFAKMPADITPEILPGISIPTTRDANLASMNNVLGKYRSGINRTSMAGGFDPGLAVGAEAEILDKELIARAGISTEEIKNRTAEISANADIRSTNAASKWAAKVANVARKDEIAGKRSLLYSTGLTNLGKIGNDLAENLISIDNQKNTLFSTKYILDEMAKEKDFNKRMQWFNMLTGGGTSDYYPTMQSISTKTKTDKTS